MITKRELIEQLSREIEEAHRKGDKRRARKCAELQLQVLAGMEQDNAVEAHESVSPYLSAAEQRLASRMAVLPQ